MHIGISTIHVIPGKTGSHEPYMFNLIRGLVETDFPHKITLFVTSGNLGLFLVEDKRFDYVIYPAIIQNPLIRIIFEQLILPIEALLRKIDVFHYPGTAASFLIRQSDVVTIHHDSITQRDSMSRIHNFYYDMILRIDRRAGLIIVPTRVYAKEMVGYYQYKKTQMRPIHHGVNPMFRSVLFADCENARLTWQITNNSILTVTNTLPHKNIPNLIRAFDILLKNYDPTVQLVMVGNIDKDILEEIIMKVAQNAQKVRSHIKLIPFVPHNMLPPIYALSKALVFISRTETFGMPLVEAMACGLPIIASNIPVHAEVLGTDVGLLVPYDHPEEIAKAMYSAIADPEKRQKLHQASLSRSLQFSWAQTAYLTVKVYEEALELAIRRKKIK